MRSDEFISLLSDLSKEYEEFIQLRKNIPLGIDSAEKVAYAKKPPFFYGNHICVTGGGKSFFIRRLLITLSCLYDKGSVCFFVLSPYHEYGELLRMRSMDITVPYLRTKEDFDKGVETLKALLRLRANGKGYPRLVVVLDGLESLEGCNRNEDLEEYRDLIELLARKEDVEVITGAELTKSIFSSYPSAFVGVGNCLVATRESGKADVTYVQDDASLTMPSPIRYPCMPSLTETVLFFNSVSKNEK